MIEFKYLIHKNTKEIIKYKDWKEVLKNKEYLKIDKIDWNTKEMLFSDEFEIIYKNDFTTKQLKGLLSRICLPRVCV
jgi:hypothetical protein